MDWQTPRRTKIVCTIGPASSSPIMLERLVRAGMNVARLNLSHGSLEQHASYVAAVRELAERLETPVAVLLDLPGPKFRVGALRDGAVALAAGAEVWLVAAKEQTGAADIPVAPPTLAANVKAGDLVLLDDGLIQMRVESAQGTRVAGRVTVGGKLVSGRGVVMPGMRFSGPYLTPELRAHVEFAVEQAPEFVALSFVSTAGDVADVDALMRERGCDAPLIAKIERGQAVEDFDAILLASAGIMVARGDLGVDIPLPRLPLVQKDIIRKCRHAGKPVITATQMLDSMTNAPWPTRAEVTDVSNAIFDGTDALMLSGETSIGKYPIEAVSMMAQIALETETALPEGLSLAAEIELERATEEAISFDAVRTARQLGAAAIVAFTRSGSTARRVCKYRPRLPILALTFSEAVARRLLLSWGVEPVCVGEPRSVDELFDLGARIARVKGLARPGDMVVITGGAPVGADTNLLKVQRVE